MNNIKLIEENRQWRQNEDEIAVEYFSAILQHLASPGQKAGGELLNMAGI